MSKYVSFKDVGKMSLSMVGIANAEWAQALQGSPSIDIVRCRECKKANTSECSLSYWDDDWGEWRVGYAGDNWYCADGERDSEKPNNSERSSE